VPVRRFGHLERRCLRRQIERSLSPRRSAASVVVTSRATSFVTVWARRCSSTGIVIVSLIAGDRQSH